MCRYNMCRYNIYNNNNVATTFVMSPVQLIHPLKTGQSQSVPLGLLVGLCEVAACEVGCGVRGWLRHARRWRRYMFDMRHLRYMFDMRHLLHLS